MGGPDMAPHTPPPLRPPAPAPPPASPARLLRRLSAREPESSAIPAVRFQRVAGLLVPRRVVRAREQQRLAIALRVALVVVEQAERDLLVVRVVAVLERVQGELAHQRLAVVAAREVGARPRHTLV